MVNIKDLKEALSVWKEDNDEIKELRKIYDLKNYLSLLFNPNHFDNDINQNEEVINYEEVFNKIDPNIRQTAVNIWNMKAKNNPNEYKFINNIEEQKEEVVKAVIEFKEVTGIS